MKSPEQLRHKLTRQWQNTETRMVRLLSNGAWPVELSIGKPSSSQLEFNSAEVKAHINSWALVKEGAVLWEDVCYRGLAQPIKLPLKWQLGKPSDWVNASCSVEIKSEFLLLDEVLSDALPQFREVLVNKRHLWRGKSIEEVKSTLELAEILEPGFAQGKPLRALGGLDVDTKFFERNEKFLVSLLDKRFGGEVKKQGLTVFLDGQLEDDHWLLIVPLEEDLLPFSRLRLSTKQLRQCELPAKTILVIENERCEHLLPKLNGVIAVLGAGLDLEWLSSPQFDSKQIIYWGDIDTWGFKMLAAARGIRPNLKAVLMDRETFDHFKDNSAVIEPAKAGAFPLVYLTETEQIFFGKLESLKKSRLEQEFISAERVKKALRLFLLN